MLSGNNSFSGGIVVSAGLLGLGSTTGAGTGILTLTTGGVFATTPNLVIGNTLEVSNGYISGTNSLTVANMILEAALAVETLTNNLSAGATFTVANGITSTSTASNVLTITGLGNTVIGTGTYSGIIANASGSITTGITYTGTGTLTLGGTSANTYSGITYVNAPSGTLILGKTGALGIGTNAFEFNAGTLQATLPLTISNPITMPASVATATFSGNNSMTFTGGVTVSDTHTFSNNLAAGQTLTFQTGTFADGAFAMTLTGTGAYVDQQRDHRFRRGNFDGAHGDGTGRSDLERSKYLYRHHRRQCGHADAQLRRTKQQQAGRGFGPDARRRHFDPAAHDAGGHDLSNRGQHDALSGQR